jgi:hypothetical protein
MLGQQQLQPQISPGEYVMVTPGNELPAWPVMPSDGDHYQNFNSPATMQSSSTSHLDWSNQLSNNDFSSIPPGVGLTGGVNTLSDQQLEFLHVPSEEDWNRWHAMPGGGAEGGNAGSDVTGLDPRRQYPRDEFSGQGLGR